MLLRVLPQTRGGALRIGCSKCGWRAVLIRHLPKRFRSCAVDGFMRRACCPLVTFDRSSSSATRTFPVKKEKYQHISPLKHVLLRPDTYVGSVLPSEEQSVYLYETQSKRMVKQVVSYIPALLKIFDEVLVNAADNKQRDPRMTAIRVTIDRDNNEVSVWNDGEGIPVEMHSEEGVYVPSLIFGTLLTSSNYDDSEVKIIGGRNGFGAKLCNIFSTEFTVETSSSNSGKRFRQTWHNNMSKCDEALVEVIPEGTSDFTKVTFKPDIEKFHMKELDEVAIGLMQRRVIDVAGTLKGVDVLLNGQKIDVHGFRDYVRLYIGKNDMAATDSEKGETYVFSEVNDRWQVAVALSDIGFEQISFVNNIATTKGGRHVDYVCDQIVSRIKEEVELRCGTKKSVRPLQVKNCMRLFLNSFIENPAFDSQTKEYLSSAPKAFGSKCVMSDAFFKELFARTDIVESIMRDINKRELRSLNRSNGRELSDLHKLEEAGDAGTNRSRQCTLIVTEGDSAKALAVAGLAVVGRKYFGVFPLRGKLTNVRGLDEKTSLQNAEVSALIRILGLKFGEDYSSDEKRNELRYGHLMIMTDQDEDGAHIRGLIVNFLHSFWPSLIRSDFIQYFITPLLKVRSGSEVIPFYSNAEFERWKRDCVDSKKYSLKYYKGLGTSSAQEAREYFAAMDRHRMQFVYGGKEDDENIELAFDKNRADDRKIWISSNSREKVSSKKIEDANRRTYSEFINEELIEFSRLDIRRSVPSAIDGLKPSQRKVLYTMMQRFEKGEVRVVQLAGAIAHFCAYHHGEQPLINTIVRLAQDFVGSNNINLLQPIGQFGTRLAGGEDCASARYIYTALSPLTRWIFPRADDSVLSYMEEDNMRIEPQWFCPIIPMVLVNGAEGIGTGWSTKVLCYNPKQIINNVQRMIDGQSLQKMLPFYRKFTGAVKEISDGRFEMSGAIMLQPSRNNSLTFQVEITELPVGVWTQKYKEKVLDALMKNGIVSDYKELHTEDSVRFLLELPKVRGLSSNTNGNRKRSLRKALKLDSVLGTSSMVLFDENNSLRKFSSIDEIFNVFFEVRRQKYIERREYQISALDAKLKFYENQYRFVEAILSKEIVIERKSRIDIESTLKQKGFEPDPLRVSHRQDDGERGKCDYSYLLDMPLIRLSSEEAKSLCANRDAKRTEMDILRRTSWRTMWHDDLCTLLARMEKIGKKRQR